MYKNWGLAAMKLSPPFSQREKGIESLLKPGRRVDLVDKTENEHCPLVRVTASLRQICRRWVQENKFPDLTHCSLGNLLGFPISSNIGARVSILGLQYLNMILVVLNLSTMHF